MIDIIIVQSFSLLNTSIGVFISHLFRKDSSLIDVNLILI